MEPLITVDNLSGYLQRPIDRYSAGICVAGASGIVRTYCHWNISRTVETLTVDGNSSTLVTLPTLRLNDVTEVRVDGDVLDPGTYSWGVNGVLMATTGYRWMAGLRRIEADVDHGYEPVPDEIAIVACAIAARLYSNPEGLAQKSSGDDSRGFASPFLAVGAGQFTGLEMRLISAYCLT
jgi:hypothetical protein